MFVALKGFDHPLLFSTARIRWNDYVSYVKVRNQICTDLEENTKKVADDVAAGNQNTYSKCR